jgi:hypothetical protein
MSAAKRIAAVVGHLNANAAAAADVKSIAANATAAGAGGSDAKCTRPAAKKPVRVLITGAAGNIGYSIVFMVAEGQMLGADQPIDLVLLDIPAMEKSVDGLVMELQDCAYPLLTCTRAHTHRIPMHCTSPLTHSLCCAVLWCAPPLSPLSDRVDERLQKGFH